MSMMRIRYPWGRIQADPNVRSSGFSLVEVLIALAILVAAVTGTIITSNVVFQSVRGTGERAAQNRAIDDDAAQISQLSETYGACNSPQGNSAACEDHAPGDSFYYFPKDPAQVDNFFAACSAADPNAHITQGFMTAINGLAAPDSGVIRLFPTRVVGADPSNHLVEVVWQSPGGRQLRSIRVTPLVSAWCN